MCLIVFIILRALSLLATGALEDLAWILHRFYPCSINLQGITLRLGSGGQSKLLGHIAQHRGPLATELLAGPLRDGIDALFALRDQLQHRELPVAMTSSTIGSRQLSGVILAPIQPVQRLINATQAPQIPIEQLGVGECLVDPFWLAEAAISVIASAVNTILRGLKWEPLLSTLSADKRSRLEQEIKEDYAHPTKHYGFGFDIIF